MTNASDKSTQLEKVRGLDALVCEAHSALAAAQKARGGATWADLLAGGFSASVLQEASVLGTDEAVVQALPALASKVGMDARSLCWARALDFESKGIKEDDVPVLAGLLCASASLTSIKLRGNTLGDEGWGAIFAGICSNKDSKIASIDASYEQIGPTGAKLIGEALRTSVSASLTSVR